MFITPCIHCTLKDFFAVGVPKRLLLCYDVGVRSETKGDDLNEKIPEDRAVGAGWFRFGGGSVHCLRTVPAVHGDGVQAEENQGPERQTADEAIRSSGRWYPDPGRCGERRG